MKSWPAWNYWMYDQEGEYRYELELAYSHPDFEFLSDTEWETEWSYRFFWSVDEAAALSFGRSPSKVLYDRYMQEMDGSSEFASYFCQLREAILSAQAIGTLPTPIPAKLYVDWTEASRVPFPPALAEAVRSNFSRMIDQMNGVEVKETPADAKAVSISSPDGGISRHDLRQYHTLLGIVYALAWRHYRLGTKRTTFGAATRIASVLDELRAQLSGARLEGNEKTIKKYLDDALDRFGHPKEFD